MDLLRRSLKPLLVTTAVLATAFGLALALLAAGDNPLGAIVYCLLGGGAGALLGAAAYALELLERLASAATRRAGGAP